MPHPPISDPLLRLTFIRRPAKLAQWFIAGAGMLSALADPLAISCQMNIHCHLHPERVTERRCTICEKAICSACLQQDSGKPYCSKCIEDGRRYNAMEASVPAPPLVEGRTWAALAASVATFLFGGMSFVVLSGAFMFRIIFTSGSKSRLNDGVLALCALLLLGKLVFILMRLASVVAR
jgi:hypothetical protein